MSADPSRPAGHLVVVEPAGWRFEADPERPLLDSARAAGIALPASCRNGTCRTCLCRATRGSVAYRIDWPGVLAEERREGWILPCIAYPASALVVEQPLATRRDAG